MEEDENEDFGEFLDRNQEQVRQYYTKPEMAQIIAVLMYRHGLKFEDLNEVYNDGCW